MANYVKFYRGTQAKYNNAKQKHLLNSDTLYFITDTTTEKGALYLGETLISKDITSFSELTDINFSETLKNKDLLVYDAFTESWVNQSILAAIGQFVGAEEGKQGEPGLVPTPGENEENYFLRGDGTWAPIESSINIETDNNSISFLEDEKTISLKDFGKKYYYQNNEGEYVIQIVDEENPWIEGLEPRVVNEDGELVLGWFKPSSTTVEGISSQLETLTNKVDTLTNTVDSVSNVVSGKADINSVYTKEETEELISNALIDNDHLTRKVFESVTEAQNFVNSINNPQDYIFMILNQDSADEDNKYLEYLYTDENKFELVGTWKVNLSGYATLDQLEGYVKKVDGFNLIENSKVAKLDAIEEGAQKNLFDKVNGDEFFIDENRQLNLVAVAMSKVTGLNNLLDSLSNQIQNKANASDIQSITEEFTTIKSNISDLQTVTNNLTTEFNGLSQTVGTLQNNLENYVTKNQYDDDMEIINEILQWHNIPEENNV